VFNDQKNIPIGQAIAGMEAYILDKDLSVVEPGGRGEIYLSGVGLARGYISQPALTSERFIANPYSKGRLNYLRMYKTGDVGRVLPDGNIEFLGRIDNQIKIRGFRVELEDVESNINTCPVVAQSVVTLITEHDNNRLVAFVVLKESTNTINSLEEIKKWLSFKLPQYAIPSQFIILDKLPLNKNGKIDRKNLPEVPSLDGTDSKEPMSDLEEGIAKIWRDVLRVEHVGPHDNFFDLGGNSILAIKVIASMKSINAYIDIGTFFNYPRIRDLSVRSKSGDNLPTFKHHQINENSFFKTSSTQKSIWFLDTLLKDKSVYIVPILTKIVGLISLGILEKCLKKVIDRHTPLRTVMINSKEGLLQKVLKIISLSRR
jgi:hypothetical protein